MARKFIVVDASNLFHRSKHVVGKGDIEERAAMCVHVIFTIISKMWAKFKGDHVVICFDNGSWRHEFHKPYKQNRRERAKARTPREVEDDEFFNGMFGKFKEFVSKHTNMTVLERENCEADDFIARWIQLHPDDEHVIVSTDSDFNQLVAENVWQYSSVSNGRLFKIDGIWDDDGDREKDPKTGEDREMPDPEWILFEKIMRGDSTDNIFPAYPKVRKRGTKNKTGLLEAFDDRHAKGFAWNNMMLQRWTDHKGDDHVVRDDYERNRTLIDLSCQPDEILEIMDDEISEQKAKDRKMQIGIRFIKFCNRHALRNLCEYSGDHVCYLKRCYDG